MQLTPTTSFGLLFLKTRCLRRWILLRLGFLASVAGTCSRLLGLDGLNFDLLKARESPRSLPFFESLRPALLFLRLRSCSSSKFHYSSPSSSHFGHLLFFVRSFLGNRNSGSARLPRAEAPRP